MKLHTAALLFFISVCFDIIGQIDTSKLMNEVENKLRNRVTISTILCDTTYDILHPSTSFRELIEKHADARTLSISSVKEPGRKIKVLCSVKDQQGKAVAGALVYLYQTDARGWYAADAPHVLRYEGDMRHARLFGYTRTDQNGNFELHTVKPSGYPQSELPAHIHIHVKAEGHREFVNEFLFDDDDRLVGEIRNRSVREGFMVAKPEPVEKPFSQKFSYFLILK